jgi:diaminopimelate decarboxylase
MSHDALTVFPITAAVDSAGHLVIGGCDTLELAEQYGTPLYVFDDETVRAQCRAHVAAFASRYPQSRVYYAGKAYLGTRLARLIRDEGLGLDVVSGGELHVAQTAGFPMPRVCMHGNNKSADELRTALHLGIGRIAVDNLDELALLDQVAAAQGVVAPVLLRLAPAIDPHTHRFMATGVADSKFGLPIASGVAAEAVERALASPTLHLHGYHVHIGSQISDLDAYRQTVGVVMAFAQAMREHHGFVPAELCLGGGWAVRYTPTDDAPDPAQVADTLTEALRSECSARRLPLPALCVEPGRAIVARSGVALYRVGGGKDVAGVRRFAFVDGGMADNIRPALYGARYTAVAANRMTETASELVTIAGRYCESSDILITDALLPPLCAGDVLAVAACGAYAPAMASNYNMALRPAIVAVANGQATLWRRRETFTDLLRCDVAAV